MHTHDPATSHRRVALKAPAPVAGAVRAARPPDAASAPRTLPSDTSEQPETRRGSAELSRRPAAGLAECGPDDPAGADGKPKGAMFRLFSVKLAGCQRQRQTTTHRNRTHNGTVCTTSRQTCITERCKVGRDAAPVARGFPHRRAAAGFSAVPKGGTGLPCPSLICPAFFSERPVPGPHPGSCARPPPLPPVCPPVA